MVLEFSDHFLPRFRSCRKLIEGNLKKSRVMTEIRPKLHTQASPSRPLPFLQSSLFHTYSTTIIELYGVDGEVFMHELNPKKRNFS